MTRRPAHKRPHKHPPDRCGVCGYDFAALDFNRDPNCPECGRPAAVRVVFGPRLYEDIAVGVGLTVLVFWGAIFLLTIPMGFRSVAWWLTFCPLTVLVLAICLRGVHVLSTRRTHGRRRAMAMTLLPLLVIAATVAGLIALAFLG